MAYRVIGPADGLLTVCSVLCLQDSLFGTWFESSDIFKITCNNEASEIEHGDDPELSEAFEESAAVPALHNVACGYQSLR